LNQIKNGGVQDWYKEDSMFLGLYKTKEEALAMAEKLKVFVINELGGV